MFCKRAAPAENKLDWQKNTYPNQATNSLKSQFENHLLFWRVRPLEVYLQDLLPSFSSESQTKPSGSESDCN